MTNTWPFIPLTTFLCLDSSSASLPISQRNVVKGMKATTLKGDRQMKTYQYKPDAQASAFHRHAENACTRLRVGLVFAVQPVGSLLPITKGSDVSSKFICGLSLMLTLAIILPANASQENAPSPAA